MSLPDLRVPLLSALGAPAGPSLGYELRCGTRLMTTLLLSGVLTLVSLAVLLITSSVARASFVGEERLQAGIRARDGLATTGLPEKRQHPRDGDPRGAPANCPYQFGSDMPTDTFCAYQGVALGSRGQVCATDLLVIWSAWSAEGASAENRAVYLGFVVDPELVLRATVSARRSDRAEVVAYTTRSDAAPGGGEVARPMAGEITLRKVRLGERWTADVLNMELRHPALGPAACAFVSYSGTFVGLIAPPLADHDIVARGVETARPLIDQRKHELTVSLQPQPIWLYADPDRLEQVMVNLLHNATASSWSPRPRR